MHQNGSPIELKFTDDDVLTLEEAANYLRVPSDTLTRLAIEGRVPGQLIGDEWRFLKLAIVQWLKYGERETDDRRTFPHPFWLDHPFMEEWLHMLEQRIVSRLKPQEESKPKPGSKEAVMKYFGIFRDEENPEEFLATLRAIRTEGD